MLLSNWLDYLDIWYDGLFLFLKKLVGYKFSWHLHNPVDIKSSFCLRTDKSGRYKRIATVYSMQLKIFLIGQRWVTQVELNLLLSFL